MRKGKHEQEREQETPSRNTVIDTEFAHNWSWMDWKDSYTGKDKVKRVKRVSVFVEFRKDGTNQAVVARGQTLREQEHTLEGHSQSQQHERRRAEAWGSRGSHGQTQQHEDYRVEQSHQHNTHRVETLRLSDE